MQEYNDGSFGDIKPFQAVKELLNDESEMKKTKAIHFGTEEQLERLKQKHQELLDAKDLSVNGHLIKIEDKLNMIIKHFNIVHIVGK